jgi:hypothetical protein
MKKIASADVTIRNIRCKTQRKYFADEKNRIVL